MVRKRKGKERKCTVVCTCVYTDGVNWDWVVGKLTLHCRKSTHNIYVLKIVK